MVFQRINQQRVRRYFCCCYYCHIAARIVCTICIIWNNSNSTIFPTIQNSNNMQNGKAFDCLVLGRSLCVTGISSQHKQYCRSLIQLQPTSCSVLHCSHSVDGTHLQHWELALSQISRKSNIHWNSARLLREFRPIQLFSILDWSPGRRGSPHFNVER